MSKSGVDAHVVYAEGGGKNEKTSISKTGVSISSANIRISVLGTRNAGHSGIDDIHVGTPNLLVITNKHGEGMSISIGVS